MNAITNPRAEPVAVTEPRTAGIGHNHPPLDLRAALEPRALAIYIAGELAPHTASADTLLAEYQRFVLATAAGIANDDVDAGAVDFAQAIKDEIDATDATRTTIKAPVLAAQKAIDGAAKAIADRLTPALTEVKRRHSTFLLAKDAMVRANATMAAARAEEAAWHARQEAETTGEVAAFIAADVAHAEQRSAEVIVFAPVLETTRMRTAAGNTSGLKDDWKYEVTDITKVPAHMLQVCDAIVKATIKSGTRSIPGIRIFNEPRAR
jgi:hypothetical protein